MRLPRPFRRRVRPLGTSEGNPSVLDEVLAEGPPLVPGAHPLAGGIVFHAMEKEEAAGADIVGDLNTEADALDDVEGRRLDSFSKAEDAESG